MNTAVGAQARPGYRGTDERCADPRMIGLSVAVGRFVEALFWAILKVAGWVTVAVVGVALAAILLVVVLRKLWTHHRR
jgi:hypothetical protein